MARYRDDEFIRNNLYNGPSPQDQARLQRRKDPSGFEFFPSRMKKYRAREALKVRDHLMVMIFLHFLFLIFECFVYNVISSLIVGEMLYLYLAYYCYMTLSPCTCWTYVVLMFISPVYNFFGLL